MLRASSEAGSRIAHDEFLGKLDYVVGSDVVAIEKSKKAWQSALVILAQMDLSSLTNVEEPSELFDLETKKQLSTATDWLAKQPIGVFDAFRSTGLQIDVFISSWIDCDQFDLELPPKFLLACGERGMAITICTND